MKNLSGTDFRASPEGVRRMAAPYKKLLASLAFATLIATPVWAATQTVTLSVPGMTCAACPFTVKKALTKVEGVTKAEVSYANSEAIVTFDDAKTSVEALTQASENAGYPASLKE